MREVKTVLLGYLYNEYELRWRRDNGTVLLCADSDNDSEVSVAAYDFLGEEGRRQLRLVRYVALSDDE